MAVLRRITNLFWLWTILEIGWAWVFPNHFTWFLRRWLPWPRPPVRFRPFDHYHCIIGSFLASIWLRRMPEEGAESAVENGVEDL